MSTSRVNSLGHYKAFIIKNNSIIEIKNPFTF